MFLLNLLPIIVTLGGAFFLFKLNFFFVLHPVRTIRATASALKEREARHSLFLALAGTLGVGNIVGVAVGISVGGAGSVFWLLVSSVFASVLKYAESTLAADMRGADGGGMLPVISTVFARKGRAVSALYACLSIALSFVMGAALQTSSVVTSVSVGFSVSAALAAAIFSVAVLLVIINGADKIKRFTAVIIPITVGIYVILCLVAIFLNADKIPEVVAAIFASSFSFEGIEGGILGTVAALAVREGFCRGLLSNEAGAGTSAYAHSSRASVPTESGLLGVCEVFFDTVVLCTLTALAVLLCIDNPSDYTIGMLLVLDSVGAVFGSFSRLLVAISVAAFAYSTVICWYYYGSRAVSFVAPRFHRAYCIAFLASVFVGGLVGDVLLIHTADFILLALSAITVLTLIKSSDRLRCLSEQGGLINPPF